MTLSLLHTAKGPKTLGLNLIMQTYRLWELWSETKSKMSSYFCALNLTHRLIYMDVERSDWTVPFDSLEMW